MEKTVYNLSNSPQQHFSESLLINNQKYFINKIGVGDCGIDEGGVDEGGVDEGGVDDCGVNEGGFDKQDDSWNNFRLTVIVT